jgi:hypothetical protein
VWTLIPDCRFEDILWVLPLEGSYVEKWLLSTMGCCSVCGRNWITGLTSAASPGVDIWSTCKVGHTLGEFLYLLICSFLLCLSWLLYCRVRKSRRDLWITLHFRFSLWWRCQCWSSGLWRRVDFRKISAFRRNILQTSSALKMEAVGLQFHYETPPLWSDKLNQADNVETR